MFYEWGETITPKYVPIHHQSDPHCKLTSNPLGENPTLPRLTPNNKRRKSTTPARNELCCKCTTTWTCATRRCRCFKQDIPCTGCACHKLCTNTGEDNHTRAKMAHLPSLPNSSNNKTLRKKASRHVPPLRHAKTSQALASFNPRNAYVTNEKKRLYADEQQAAQRKQGLRPTLNHVPLHLEAWLMDEQVLQTLPSEEEDNIARPRNLLSKFEGSQTPPETLHPHHLCQMLHILLHQL